MGFLDRLKDLVGGGPAAPTHVVGVPNRGAELTEPERVVEALIQVIDPEINIDIVNMGLIREVEVEGGTATVRMTLSTAGCPVGPMIVEQVEDAVRSAGFEPDVRLEFDPPWSPEDMTPEGRAMSRRR